MSYIKTVYLSGPGSITLKGQTFNAEFSSTPVDVWVYEGAKEDIELLYGKIDSLRKKLAWHRVARRNHPGPWPALEDSPKTQEEIREEIARLKAKGL